MITRTYSELIGIPTFEERFEYLKLNGIVGESTFGFDRYLNQSLYHNSKEWRQTRAKVIVRDNGCDLGIEDRKIGHTIIVHHMNPIGVEDIENRNPSIFDPEFLICVSIDTHNAIHFGNSDLLVKLPTERRPGDTCPWRV